MKISAAISNDWCDVMMSMHGNARVSVTFIREVWSTAHVFFSLTLYGLYI